MRKRRKIKTTASGHGLCSRDNCSDLFLPYSLILFGSEEGDETWFFFFVDSYFRLNLSIQELVREPKIFRVAAVGTATFPRVLGAFVVGEQKSNGTAVVCATIRIITLSSVVPVSLWAVVVAVVVIAAAAVGVVVLEGSD